MIDFLKRCRHCDECIGVNARRCPKCQSWQSRRGDVPNDPKWWWSLLPLIVFGLVFGWLTLRNYSWNREGADFAKYREQIDVIESKFLLSDERALGGVVTIGRLKNNSPVKWERLAIEVQYFNRGGDLVGTDSSRLSDLVLLPGTEHAFQVSGSRVLSVENYFSQKVFVRDAREVGKWP